MQRDAPQRGLQRQIRSEMIDLTLDLEKFPLFPELPTELRNEIWTYVASTPRHISLPRPRSGNAQSNHDPLSKPSNEFTLYHFLVPPVLHTCIESRRQALKVYTLWISSFTWTLEADIYEYTPQGYRPIRPKRIVGRDPMYIKRAIFANFEVDRFCAFNTEDLQPSEQHGWMRYPGETINYQIDFSSRYYMNGGEIQQARLWRRGLLVHVQHVELKYNDKPDDLTLFRTWHDLLGSLSQLQKLRTLKVLLPVGKPESDDELEYITREEVLQIKIVVLLQEYHKTKEQEAERRRKGEQPIEVLDEIAQRQLWQMGFEIAGKASLTSEFVLKLSDFGRGFMRSRSGVLEWTADE